MSTQFDVVIVGGGAGGIAVASSLLKRRRSLSIAVIEPSDRVYYQPSWTLVGAGEFDIKKSERRTASVIPAGVEWIKDAVETFDPENNSVITANGNTISYGGLIVAAGLKLNWGAIEGLEETLGQNGVTSNYRFDLAPYTWDLVKALKGGTAVFTQPGMPIKCAGAPQKAVYLSCNTWEQNGALADVKVKFHNAGGVLFGVADFVPVLNSYMDRYGVERNYNSNLVAVNGETQTATFESKDEDGNVNREDVKFDMLHVVPPQVAPDFIRNSPLANDAGWMDVDQTTLQSTKANNIFGLGDVMSAPNAKTAAAVRKQAPIVAVNLLQVLDGQAPGCQYDGYGACPLTVEKGKIVMAEFGYGGKLIPTLPLEPKTPRRLNWILKKHIMPPLYWDGMFKGNELFVKPD